MPLRIPCVLVRSRSLLARFFHTCRHTWLIEGFAPYARPYAIAFAYPNIVLRQPTQHSLSSWRCSLVVNWPHS